MAALAPAVAEVRNAVRRSLAGLVPAGAAGTGFTHARARSTLGGSGSKPGGAGSASGSAGPPSGGAGSGPAGGEFVPGGAGSAPGGGGLAAAGVGGWAEGTELGVGPVLVACSGGGDSMALAVAARFVTRRMGVRCGLVTVDHRLQDGSAERAGRLAEWARSAGFEPVDVRVVRVGEVGGPEAAAREARYEALEDAAVEHGASVVLLGHTLDDQAETVLLALARGSGPRGLAGMPVRRERRGVAFVRPLLDVRRSRTREACEADGVPVWDDPHNVDAAFARSRIRPVVQALGGGVVENLARTARLVGADSSYLDGVAAEALEKALVDPGGLAVSELAGMAGPIRTRVLHAWALRLGAPGTALSHRHVGALDALVTDWHGQGAVALPGGISVVRTGGRLRPAG